MAEQNISPQPSQSTVITGSIVYQSGEPGLDSNNAEFHFGSRLDDSIRAASTRSEQARQAGVAGFDVKRQGVAHSKLTTQPKPKFETPRGGLLDRPFYYFARRITPTPVVFRSLSGYFSRAFSACVFVLNGFDNGVNLPFTHWYNNQRSIVFGICGLVRRDGKIQPISSREFAVNPDFHQRCFQRLDIDIDSVFMRVTEETDQRELLFSCVQIIRRIRAFVIDK
jgi:hypothetical protein